MRQRLSSKRGSLLVDYLNEPNNCQPSWGVHRILGSEIGTWKRIIGETSTNADAGNCISSPSIVREAMTADYLGAEP